VTNGSDLRASCQKKNGSYVPSELNISTCGANQIENLDGQLSCQQASVPPSPLPPITQEICSGDTVPKGWIIYDEKWSPTKCGNPSSITSNVLLITKYDGLQIGATLDVCAGQTIPDGWVLINKKWIPTRCGSPSSITNNVETIQHLNQAIIRIRKRGLF
jgi:hypothetical protein